VIVPAFVVDRLPIRLWKPANLHLGYRLHFCIAGARDDPDRAVRTVEWNGRVIGLGHREVPTGLD